MTRIHLVTRRELARMGPHEKLRFILDEVQLDKILVLQEALHPREEALLIEHTMRAIEPDGFRGIELESHPPDPACGLLARVRRDRGLTLVGPADRLRTVSKSLASIEALIADAGPEAP